MNLGLQRGKVRLVAYDPEWATLFETETVQLKALLGDALLGIEHVGSTAIPGMDAKPILDLMVAVKAIDDYATYTEQLSGLGYVFRQDNRDEQEHVLFVKGPEEKRTHYLKLTTLNSDFWREHILFRDYLIQHTERAAEYQQLKRNLLEKHADERARYTEEKAAFIKQTIALAKQEF
ncbi:MAG: GrpB family protein [Patescibacteria group bacterium]